MLHFLDLQIHRTHYNFFAGNLLTLPRSQKDKEDLEEVSTELELADEDELVPYQIGDSFVSLPLPEVQQMLAESIQQTDADISVIEDSLSSMRDEMKGLKAQLYARFGKGINLET